MDILHTQRLTLRPWTAEDAQDMYEYAKDPSVGPMAGWKPHSDIEETRRILEHFIVDNDVWAVVLRDTGKVIGSLGLHGDGKRPDIPGVKMLGYVLSPAYWGKGYMTEAVMGALRYAFEDLRLDMVSVYHYPHNSRSRRVIEKCGFVCEGTLRRGSKIYDQTVYDDVMYSMTREEYLAKG